MRILAGEFRGRTLLSPSGRRTRPITGLAKKSVFGMLGERLAGAAVADLYCGTGTLGLEALSRGAAWCAFAERDRGALGRLKRNIESLGVGGRCVVWPGDVASRLAERLAEAERALDVAFVDPPYAASRGWSWDRESERLFAPLASRLAAGGLVVLRVPSELRVPERLGPLAARRTRRYGGMVVILLARSDEAGEGHGGPAGGPGCG